MNSKQQLLAVLCADITGGTKLKSVLDGSEAEYAIRRCEKRIAQTVQGFQGRLVKRRDSRLLAFFPDTEGAIQSAVDMQKRVSALPPISGVGFGVRVGVCAGHSGEESRFFEDENENPATTLSDLAEPGQLLLSVPSRSKGRLWSDKIARMLPRLSLSCGGRKLGVFELDWRHDEVSSFRWQDSPAKGGQIWLHYRERRLVVDAEHPKASIGRLECDVLMTDKRVSRVHARVERRGERFFLVDQSTNGTFVTLGDGAEQRIHRREVELSGVGLINCCGSSAKYAGDSIRFCLESAP